MVHFVIGVNIEYPGLVQKGVLVRDLGICINTAFTQWAHTKCIEGPVSKKANVYHIFQLHYHCSTWRQDKPHLNQS